MLIKRGLVERYVAGAILPYLGLSAALLTAALLAQQTTRFAEIVGTARAPLRLTVEVLVNLLPNILVFTIPTATLVGTVIGFSRLSGDSELIAMRAAGVSTHRVIAPTILLGVLLSLLAFQVSFNVAPEAARDLRRIALEAALSKLESPVEPRTFYTEMPGKIVFVREGEQESGQWGRVFIHWQEQDGKVRLVTARSGRIDSSGEQTELVLSDAEVITLPALERGAEFDGRQITSEKSSMLRMKDERLDAGRKALVRQLNDRKLLPEEMGWRELNESVRTADDTQKRQDLLVALHRRTALCLAPLIFSIFGGAVGLRARRGGRGVGMLLSIITLIVYYLLTIGGGHLGRAGVIPPAFGVWLANGVVFAFGILLLLGGETISGANLKAASGARVVLAREGESASGKARLNWGLMDRHVLRSLGWSFAGAFVLLVSVFLIFTLFDLLRFLAAQKTSAELMARYLLYILPFASVAMAPMSLLVATLVTYALMARRSEAVAWWASGRSVYRLIVPGVIFASAVCAGLWLVQEEVLPQANRVQNSLRAQIRGGGAQLNAPSGRQWLATPDLLRFYNYYYDPAREALVDPVAFEFDGGGVHLRRIILGERGQWAGDRQDGLQISGATLVRKAEGGVEVSDAGRVDLTEPIGVFKPTLNSPAESDFKQLSDDLKRLRGRGDPSVPLIAVARERKRSDPFSPLILSLIGMPLAFAFGRRNAIAALCAAVVIGVAFWAATSGFYYLGMRSFLPAVVAAWTPPMIFAAIGVYLLTRVRT